MDASAGMCGRRAEIDAAHRRAVVEEGEDRPEEELMVEVRRTAAQVAADEVLVHAFEVIRREDGATEDQLAETRRPALDPLLDAIGERLFALGPTLRHLVRHAAVGPERVLAGWGAAGVQERLLA